jgi:hypothetical protein
MGTKTDDLLGERVILAGRDKDVEERNVMISFSQSPERATATRGRVPLVMYIYTTFHTKPVGLSKSNSPTRLKAILVFFRKCILEIMYLSIIK